MTLSRSPLVLIATAGSAAMLLGAFGFEHIGNLPPCAMCIWQRWPHGIVIILGMIAYLTGNRGLALLCGLIILTGAGIGFFHAGVEQGWWEGPSTCTAGSIQGLTTEQLMEQIQNAPLVRCDEIPWSLFGLSMAAWNGLISLGLAGLWLLSLRKR